MTIIKCDFCGADNAEEVKLPQPNEVLMLRRGQVIGSFKKPGVYYKSFDLCPNCQQKIFNFIETSKTLSKKEENE